MTRAEAQSRQRGEIQAAADKNQDKQLARLAQAARVLPVHRQPVLRRQQAAAHHGKGGQQFDGKRPPALAGQVNAVFAQQREQQPRFLSCVDR